MSNVKRFVRQTVAATALISAAACGDGSGAGPEIAKLSGLYGLSDWLYILNGDTLPITSDSYIQIEFLDEEHVTGEGIVWVRVDDGTTGGRRLPLLGVQNSSGEVLPLPIEGWYYIRNAGVNDTLRFSLAAGAGKDSWIEAFPWVLTENRESFRFEVEGVDDELRIVHHKTR